MNRFVILGVAIVAEVIATSALQASGNLSRLWPTVVAVVGYAVAFHVLSLALRSIPVGIAEYGATQGRGVWSRSATAWRCWSRTRRPRSSRATEPAQG